MKQSKNEANKKRNVLTVPDQVKVIELVDQKHSYQQVSKIMKCSKTQVANIISRRQKIEKMLETSPLSDIKTRKRVRVVEFPVLEESLFRWVSQQRRNHGYITNETLREKAIEFHGMLPKTKENPRKFSASEGWISKFKQRNGLRYISISGEKLSANKDAVKPFKARLLEKMKEMDISMDELYNADEGALFWKIMPKKTLVFEDEKNAPGRKIQKDRITIMPCANATGNHKLPLQIIGRSAKPRCFKNKYPSGVFYYSSANAWQTKALFSDYFYEKFVPEVNKYCEKLGKAPKALLVLDNASAHLETDKLITDDKNIQCIFLPPNTTSILQPMDQNVILPTKTDYRKNLLRHILTAGGDFASELKKFDIKQAIDMVRRSWDQVEPSVIFRSWKKILGETEMYKNLEPLNYGRQKPEKISEIQKLLMKVQRKTLPIENHEKINEKDVIDWVHEDDMEIDCEELTDQEIFARAEKTIREDENCALNTEELRTDPETFEPIENLGGQENYQKGLEYVEYLLELFADRPDTETEESLHKIKDIIIDRILE